MELSEWCIESKAQNAGWKERKKGSGSVSFVEMVELGRAEESEEDWPLRRERRVVVSVNERAEIVADSVFSLMRKRDRKLWERRTYLVERRDPDRGSDGLT